MEKAANRRRQYFIDKKFQINFILKFCLIAIFSSLLIGVALFYLSRDSNTVAIENTRVVVKQTADFILPMIIQTLLIVTIFSAATVYAITLLASHKIAGPLYRLKREIEQLKEGDLRRNFSIRAKDQLQDFAKSLSLMCNSLMGKYSQIKEKCDTLNKHLRQRNLQIADENKAEVSRLLDEIDSALNSFKA